jgi:hypothetical protein
MNLYAGERKIKSGRDVVKGKKKGLRYMQEYPEAGSGLKSLKQ